MIVCSPPEAAHYQREIRKCRSSPAYFLDRYGHIYDAVSAAWVPFRLWPAQFQALDTIVAQRLLKARQLGLTWLVLGYALWLVLLWPAVTVLLFSRRDDEAADLLGTRLRGLYERLPAWLRVQSFLIDNDHEWQLSNGSRVLAFPTTAGDSYTASLVLVDEADLVPDLDRLMRAVKPTIDGGGRMVLLSRADKTRPQSPFKRIYAGAKQRLTEWTPLFLPWDARPDRDQNWYVAQKADIFHRTGSQDDLHEQYPVTDLEALAPRAHDKRFAPEWLQQCFVEAEPLSLTRVPEAPAIPGLAVYALPQTGHHYVIGADPAEGNPTSDDSALVVLDTRAGEEVASLAGKFQPAVFAAHAHALGKWYNDAAILVERNNHGHAVLEALNQRGQLRLLSGHDDKTGWLSSQLGKVILYDRCADAIRNHEVILHTFATYAQLTSIDGSTLRAPQGESDDRADALALACAGRPAAGNVWWHESTYDRKSLSVFHPDNLPEGIFLSDSLSEGTPPF